MNRTLEELGNQLIRLADSSGVLPGSDEFRDMILNRMILPDNIMTNHLKENGLSPYKGALRHDVVVDSMDSRYIRFLFLKSLVKWANRNRGMGMEIAATILNIHGDGFEDSSEAAGGRSRLLKKYGEDCLKFGLPDFTEWLDGSDSYGYGGAGTHLHHPDTMNSGNSGSVGINGYA